MSQVAAVVPELSQGRPALAAGASTAPEAVVDPRWANLFRVAGVGALLTGILIPLQIIAFIAWPPPEAGVASWFQSFQDSAFIGLVSFDLAILLEEVLVIPIVLAMYVLLRKNSESLMLVAAAVWLVSVALFIGSNTGFEMLSLSSGYSAAATDAERAMYLAAGQAMVSSYMGQGSSFVMGYLLATVAGLLVGIGMLRSTVFPRLAAWAVIVANVLGFGLFLPGIGIAISIFSVFILIAWYLAVGWRLLRLPTAQ